MAEDAGEKTEAPTQRRRDDAHQKGDRLQSRELATALGGIAGALWLWAFAPGMARGLREATAAALHPARSADGFERAAADIAGAVMAFVWPILPPLAALAGMALLAALAAQLIGGGVDFNLSLLAPKPSRMNPAAGLKRIFGSKGLIELVKALAKALILVGLSALLLWNSRDALASLSALPRDAAFATAADLGLRLFLWLSLGLALIAGGDLPVQILQWLKRLRMTKQEVKDEVKQQEGSAEVKHAIRRMARETLKSANREAMADATVVLTNPTHFAVALRYRPGADSAPTIVARGRGVVAEAIRELAAERGVTVLSYPSVARAIYFTGKVGQEIRADLYQAVATILAYVLRVGGLTEPPEAEAPGTALFDAHGRKL